MFYFTFIPKKPNSIEQMDLFDSIFYNKKSKTKEQLQEINFFTVYTDKMPDSKFIEAQKENLNNLRYKLNSVSENFLSNVDDCKKEYYKIFKIPKKSGGFRTITAPNDELKKIQKEIKDILQYNCRILPHNSAYAYIPGRSAANAVEKHRKNNSKHFLHIDLKDFFTSCNSEFIIKSLNSIYPLNLRPDIVKKITDLATLNDGLPQGTPLSPFLTNIIMIPLDYKIKNALSNYNSQYFVYTRYADDMDISSKYEFQKEEILNLIKDILKDTPLKINQDKVRYNTISGKNWHLGLMLNRNNDITIGHEKKRKLKQELLEYCLNKSEWSTTKLQQFLGQLSYFKHIEPDYANFIIDKYSVKYNNSINITDEIRLAIGN